MLNSQKKFRDRGNRQGAIKGWQLLEQSELGKLHDMKAQRGTDRVCTDVLNYCIGRKSP